MDNNNTKPSVLTNPIVEEALLQITDEKQREIARRAIEDLVQTMQKAGETLQKSLIG
jgi:hypothetical protein